MALKIQEEYIKTLKKAENIYITSPLTGNGSDPCRKIQTLVNVMIQYINLV